jgi:drug/metabolite transporter (DMT)-like permease
MQVILSTLSAILYGTADFSGGFASRENATLSVVAVSQTIGLLVALIALPFIGGAVPSPTALFWGALGGASGAVGLFMLYRGIARSVVAIVSPASALVGALVPMLFGIVMGERPSTLAVVGAALCLPAILLLAIEKGGMGTHVRAALLYGVVAGLGFGGFFVALSRTPPGSGLWPLIAARAASISLFIVVLTIRRDRISIAKPGRILVAVSGACDMGANILFLFASRIGLLFIASSITSLYPGPTVILARVFMHQRLGAFRLAGLILALAGMVLISVG